MSVDKTIETLLQSKVALATAINRLNEALDILIKIEDNPDVPPPPPIPPSGPIRRPFGYYALQPGGQSKDDPSPPRGGRLISESDLRLEQVVGLTIRMRPNWSNYLNFAEDSIARCEKTNTPFTLLMMGGGTTNPWSSVNLENYEKLARSLGKAFATHPLCYGVHVTGCSPQGVSEELHWKAANTPTGVVQTNRELIDIWGTEFPIQTLLLAIGGGNPSAMQQIIDYGISRYKDRFLVKHNSLKTGTSLDADHNQLVQYAVKKGTMGGFEMVGASNEERFGGGGIMAGIAQGVKLLRSTSYDPKQAYYAVYPTDLQALRPIS
jgi:hypothetical protein